jgi:hypothetical protein
MFNWNSTAHILSSLTEHSVRQTLILCVANMETVHSIISVLLLSIVFVFIYAQSDNNDRAQNPPFQLPPFDAAQKGRQSQGRRSRIRATEGIAGPSEGSSNFNFQRTRNNTSTVRLLFLLHVI